MYQEPPSRPFLGRKTELEMLQRLRSKMTSSLVVIKGRRRIGKSRLALEFGKSFDKAYVLTGFPPKKGVTAQKERDDFAGQMERILAIPGLKGTDDWGNLFWHLAKATSVGKVLLVLDEINWMGSKDPTFLGKLKSAWDLHFQLNPQCIMILSGSMASWIEDNILGDTGFMGRTSLELTLQELPLQVCNEFWGPQKDNISAYEKFKLLSITGGIPRYLEEIDPNRSAEDNIKFLAFQPGGLLFHEFDRIFDDLFKRRKKPYKKILESTANDPVNLDQICQDLEYKKGGVISQYLEELVETGYLAKDYTWNIKNGLESNLSHYRLKDNYLRFYLKYIEPNKSKIQKNSLQIPPAWDTIMGLQFENLVLNNNQKIYQLLGIEPDEVVNDNPYFQNQTKAHSGCQIDYLIQTMFNTLYACEIKFSREKVGFKVISEVNKKIDALARPKNFTVRPVLIHVNGVVDSVIESRFFSKIINFSDFLLR